MLTQAPINLPGMGSDNFIQNYPNIPCLMPILKLNKGCPSSFLNPFIYPYDFLILKNLASVQSYVPLPCPSLAGKCGFLGAFS